MADVHISKTCKVFNSDQTLESWQSSLTKREDVDPSRVEGYLLPDIHLEEPVFIEAAAEGKDPEGNMYVEFTYEIPIDTDFDQNWAAVFLYPHPDGPVHARAQLIEGESVTSPYALEVGVLVRLTYLQEHPMEAKAQMERAATAIRDVLQNRIYSMSEVIAKHNLEFQADWEEEGRIMATLQGIVDRLYPSPALAGYPEEVSPSPSPNPRDPLVSRYDRDLILFGG